MTEALTLYHSVESTCAQKVRLVMAEKGLAWEEIRLNLRKGEQFDPAYLKLNPKAVVPTLVHDGQAIPESTVIAEYIEDAFPEPPLRPPDLLRRAQMRLLVKSVDDEVHPAVGVLTYAIVLRHQMDALMSPDELQRHFARVADPMRRERQRQTHQAGLQSPTVKPALAALRRLIEQMDDALAGGPWLAGADFTIADATAAPYAMRIQALGLNTLWSEKPPIAAWLARVAERTAGLALEDPWGSEGFHTLVERSVAAELQNIRAVADDR